MDRSIPLLGWRSVAEVARSGLPTGFRFGSTLTLLLAWLRPVASPGAPWWRPAACAPLRSGHVEQPLLTIVNIASTFPYGIRRDPAKEARNLEKHGISFVAGAQALASGSTFEFQSDRGNETRWVVVGTHPATKNVIAVVYTMRKGRHPIISARRARKNEEEDYRRHVERAAAEAEERGEARPDEQR